MVSSFPRLHQAGGTAGNPEHPSARRHEFAIPVGRPGMEDDGPVVQGSGGYPVDRNSGPVRARIALGRKHDAKGGFIVPCDGQLIQSMSRHRVQDIEQIEECHSVAGDENYILKIRVSTPADLEELIGRIRGAAHVSTRTTVVLSTPWE